MSHGSDIIRRRLATSKGVSERGNGLFFAHVDIRRPRHGQSYDAVISVAAAVWAPEARLALCATELEVLLAVRTCLLYPCSRSSASPAPLLFQPQFDCYLLLLSAQPCASCRKRAMIR